MSRRSQIMVGRTLYQMAVVTLIASICWVVLAVYQAARDPVNVQVDKTILEPLNPVIDEGALAKLSQRRQMSEADWSRLGTVVEELKQARQAEILQIEPVREPVTVETETSTQEATEAGVTEP